MPNDIRTLWQSQAGEPSNVSLELIRYNAEKLERGMRQHVMGAYFLGLAILPVCLFLFWQIHEIFIRMGAVVLALWGVSLVYRVRHGARPGRLSPEAVLTVSLEFYRRELERQRFYFRGGSWLDWLVVLSAALFLTQAVAGTMRNRGTLVWMAAQVLWIFYLLKSFRRKHQIDIDELESLPKPKHVNPPPTIPWE